MVDYFYGVQRLAKIRFFEHGKKIRFRGATVTPIGFQGKGSEIFGFLVEAKGKRLFYAPCDTLNLKEKFIPKNLDMLVTECGLFSGSLKTEISFEEMLSRIERNKPKKATLTVLTHIEEFEVNLVGTEALKEAEKKFKNLNLRFAFDGMKIKL